MDTPLPVYLVHWNEPEWIASASASILASDIPVEVTIIDNGSQTGGINTPDKVHIVASGSNLGYAGGANIGLRRWIEGSTEFCVVGAHDMHIESDTLRLLIEPAQANTQFGVLGPNVVPGEKGRLLGETNGIEERVWLSGTCLLLRRDCIERIGLFDELLHSYAEDEELGMRALRHGFKVGRVPHAKVHSIGSSSPHAKKLWMGNRVVLAARYHGLKSAVPIVARYLRTACRSAALMLLFRGTRSRAHRTIVEQNLGAACIGVRKLAVGGWRQPRY